MNLSTKIPPEWKNIRKNSLQKCHVDMEIPSVSRSENAGNRCDRLKPYPVKPAGLQQMRAGGDTVQGKVPGSVTSVTLIGLYWCLWRLIMKYYEYKSIDSLKKKRPGWARNGLIQWKICDFMPETYVVFFPVDVPSAIWGKHQIYQAGSCVCVFPSSNYPLVN